MNRYHLTRCLILLAGGWLCALPSPGPAAGESPPSAAQIDAWASQLGSPDFAVRDRAARALTNAWPASVPAVTRAGAAADPEVARLAEEILKAFQKKQDERYFAALTTSRRLLEVDSFVEAAVAAEGNDDPIWQALTELGWKGIDVGQKDFGRLKGVTPTFLLNKDFKLLKASQRPEVLPRTATPMDQRHYLFRGASLKLGYRSQARLLAATGSVESETVVSDFYFVNGSVEVSDHVGAAVVLCGGDFRTKPQSGVRPGRIQSCLIVARGDITCPNRSVTDCVLLAGGDIHISAGARLKNSTLIAAGRIHIPADAQVTNCTITPSARDPLHPFSFFSLESIGLTVAADTGGVRVTAVQPKSPLAAAGLAAADTVTAIDGKDVRSVAAARDLLRAGFVRGWCQVTVKRGDQSRQLLVRFPD